MRDARAIRRVCWLYRLPLRAGTFCVRLANAVARGRRCCIRVLTRRTLRQMRRALAVRCRCRLRGLPLVGSAHRRSSTRLAVVRARPARANHACRAHAIRRRRARRRLSLARRAGAPRDARLRRRCTGSGERAGCAWAARRAHGRRVVSCAADGAHAASGGGGVAGVARCRSGAAVARVACRASRALAVDRRRRCHRFMLRRTTQSNWTASGGALLCGVRRPSNTRLACAVLR